MLSRANPSHQARMMLYAKFIDAACKAANVTNMMDLPQSVRDKCWVDAVFESSHRHIISNSCSQFIPHLKKLGVFLRFRIKQGSRSPLVAVIKIILPSHYLR